jgi:broad-specificity NMP kinase
MNRDSKKRTEIVVVCGPPGSGKTSYIRENKWEGDLVWDWDAISAAITLEPLYTPWPEGAMDFLLGMRERFCAIAAHGDGRVRRVWIIVSERNAFTAQLTQLGAVVIEMKASEEDCRERLALRGPEATRTLDKYLARTQTKTA